MIRLPWHRKSTMDDAFLLVKRATDLYHEDRLLKSAKTLRKAYMILSLRMPLQGYEESLSDYCGRLLYNVGRMLEYLAARS